MTDAMPADRTPDLVLARVHLRLGSIELARAELETLAGHDGLDDDGLVDLAEARWRTGDIDGAGEAAMAVLRDDDGPLLALIVAAEAAAARGRPTEARRFVDRAIRAANGTIDRVFAGMPRGSAWPPDAAAPPPAPTTMFDPPQGPGRSTPRPPRRPPAVPPVARASAIPAETAETIDPSEPATIEIWEDASAAEPPVAPGPDAASALATAGAAAAEHAEAVARIEADAMVDSGLPLGDEALEDGRAALDAGDIDGAAVSLSMVLRLDPERAPSVVELLDERTEPGLAFVRGDAYRLVGRALDALAAYAKAVRPVAVHEDDVDQDPPQGDPA